LEWRKEARKRDAESRREAYKRDAESRREAYKRNAESRREAYKRNAESRREAYKRNTELRRGDRKRQEEARQDAFEQKRKSIREEDAKQSFLPRRTDSRSNGRSLSFPKDVKQSLFLKRPEAIKRKREWIKETRKLRRK
jgi:hypothetical protein